MCYKMSPNPKLKFEPIPLVTTDKYLLYEVSKVLFYNI